MSNDRLVSRWIDPLFRFFAAAVTAWFVYRVFGAFIQAPGRLTLIFLLISELMSLLTIIASRQPTFRDLNPAYMALTSLASFLVPLLISVQDNAAAIPERMGEVLACIGILFQIYAKISLGRSFGLLAARRVIKVRGAYRFVRHPIYLGYFIAHVAFLLTNFSARNLIIIACLYCMQIMRALREEKILSVDDVYRAYCQQTRYRFIYGIF